MPGLQCRRCWWWELVPAVLLQGCLGVGLLPPMCWQVCNPKPASKDEAIDNKHSGANFPWPGNDAPKRIALTANQVWTSRNACMILLCVQQCGCSAHTLAALNVLGCHSLQRRLTSQHIQAAGCDFEQPQQCRHPPPPARAFFFILSFKSFHSICNLVKLAYLDLQGLHRMVVMRSWHSAAVTATFPSFAAAVSSFMAWSQLPAVPAAAAAAGSAAAMQGAGLEAAAAAAAAVPTFDWQHLGWCNPSQWPTQPLPAAGASSTASSNTYSMQGSSREAAGGAVGVFYNHPNQGCYVPSLPHLMVLALRPSMQGLGLQQRLLLAQMLQLAGSRQLVAGSQQHLLAQQQGLGEWLVLCRCIHA